MGEIRAVKGPVLHLMLCCHLLRFLTSSPLNLYLGVRSDGAVELEHAQRRYAPMRILCRAVPCSFSMPRGTEFQWTHGEWEFTRLSTLTRQVCSCLD